MWASEWKLTFLATFPGNQANNVGLAATPKLLAFFFFFDVVFSTLALFPLPPFTTGSLELQHRLQQQPEAALYDVVDILGEAAAAYRKSRENILGISSWCDNQFAPPLVGGGQGGERRIGYF